MASPDVLYVQASPTLGDLHAAPVNNGLLRTTQTILQNPTAVVKSGQVKQETVVNAGPDIEWDPCLDTYLQRVERLAALHEQLPDSVPQGFPERIIAPRVWTGADFQNEAQFVLTLSNEELDEVDGALQKFIGESL